MGIFEWLLELLKKIVVAKWKWTTAGTAECTTACESLKLAAVRVPDGNGYVCSGSAYGTFRAGAEIGAKCKTPNGEKSSYKCLCTHTPENKFEWKAAPGMLRDFLL